MATQLSFDLIEREDRNGDSYYVGSYDFPADISLEKVTFFVFHPISGDPLSRPRLSIRARTPIPTHNHDEDKSREDEGTPRGRPEKTPHVEVIRRPSRRFDGGSSAK